MYAAHNIFPGLLLQPLSLCAKQLSKNIVLPHFELEGTGSNALWLANGNPNFGMLVTKYYKDSFPLKQLDQIPIRLHLGEVTWGSKHIDTKHKPFLAHFGGHTAVQVVWRTLQTSGVIYTASSGNKENHKIKMIFMMGKQSLLIAQFENDPYTPYFSVTTCYERPSRLDGQMCGRYKPQPFEF